MTPDGLHAPIMDVGPNYRFGRFELDPAAGLLRAGGERVPLNPRAFKLLHLLVRNHPRLVTKDEIMEQVWEGLFVEENNLAVQVSALRKALRDGPHGEPYVVNVPGQGYRFVGPVTMAGEERPDAPAATEAVPRAATASHHDRRVWIIAGAAAVTLVMLGLGALALLLRGPGAGAGAPRLSIAVLPFHNLSSDPEQTYLADAVSDDLTTDLARLPGSFVIARESADTYRDKPATAQQIGRELGVRYMLEGSVRPAADRLLINAQLIDTGSGAHLWAERFDTARAEIGAAQREIVSRIASALSFHLVQIEGQRSAAERPKDPDALDLFFRARSMLDRDRSLKGMEAAQPLLEKAIALQPDFVDALNELSWLLLRRDSEFDDPGDDGDWTEAERLTKRALAIDPHSAGALVNRGQLLLIDNKCPDALSSFESALSGEPSNVVARDGIGRCGDMLGHPEEMVQAMREALALSPEDPGINDRYGHLGMAMLLLDRPADAIEWLRKAEAGQSEPVERFERGLIEAYALTGRMQEAREKFAAYDRLWPRRSVWRESCYASRAVSQLPGLKHALAALQAAGMPEFADETIDQGVAPATTLQLADFYAPTPLTVPGAVTIKTTELAALLARTPSPVVLDVSCGEAVIAGALFAPWADDGDRLDDRIQVQLGEELGARTGGDFARPVVTVGSGVHGWAGYGAALRVLALGYRSVYWYRGGEEAWAKAHMPAEDRRDP
jgi:TolB-like protein/DNA-binding winged helix-turn-helix (wHTH) protein/rhodanese-related sulfurtransferase